MARTEDQFLTALHSWVCGDDPPYPGDHGEQAEDARERDWTHLAQEARAFKARHGAAALLRCISIALEDK